MAKHSHLVVVFADFGRVLDGLRAGLISQYTRFNSLASDFLGWAVGRRLERKHENNELGYFLLQGSFKCPVVRVHPATY
jgi:hypothetical protein